MEFFDYQDGMPIVLSDGNNMTENYKMAFSSATLRISVIRFQRTELILSQ